MESWQGVDPTGASRLLDGHEEGLEVDPLEEVLAGHFHAAAEGVHEVNLFGGDGREHDEVAGALAAGAEDAGEVAGIGQAIGGEEADRAAAAPEGAGEVPGFGAAVGGPRFAGEVALGHLAVAEVAEQAGGAGGAAGDDGALQVGSPQKATSTRP
jgi:hypothetical protein